MPDNDESFFGDLLDQARGPLELDDFKRIALESLAQEPKEELDEPIEAAIEPELSLDDADTRLEQVVTEVEVLDREIDGFQGKINQLAIRKVTLQRQVETLLADFAEEFNLVARFDHGNGLREKDA